MKMTDLDQKTGPWLAKFPNITFLFGIPGHLELCSSCLYQAEELEECGKGTLPIAYVDENGRTLS